MNVVIIILVVLTDISNIYGKKLRDLLFLRGYVSIVSDAEHNTIEYTYKHSLQETNTQGPNGTSSKGMLWMTEKNCTDIKIIWSK
jgi:hypothetical protein